MCFPGASLLTGVMSTVVGMEQQQQQYAAQLTQFNQNYQDALSDNRITEDRLQAQEVQENQEYAGKDQIALIQGAEKQAQVTAAAATGGVAGNSVQAITNEIGTQVNFQRATLNQQWNANVDQTESEKESGVAQETSRIAQVAQPTPPDGLSALVSLAGAGLKAGASPAGQSFFGSVTGGSGTAAAPDVAGDTSGVASFSGGGIGMM